MTSLAFNAAPIEAYDTFLSNTPIESKKNDKSRNTTRNVSSKVDTMRKQIGIQGMDNTDDLADFIPLERNHSRLKEKDPSLHTPEPDAPVSVEQFNTMPSLATEDYYNTVVPYYDTSKPATNPDLTNKLEYLIHLLEEQRDIKRGTVTEELILYTFLGIFIIFVLDSFVKVGKYTR
jgi:hypothetical protein